MLVLIYVCATWLAHTRYISSVKATDESRGDLRVNKGEICVRRTSAASFRVQPASDEAVTIVLIYSDSPPPPPLLAVTGLHFIMNCD